MNKFIIWILTIILVISSGIFVYFNYLSTRTPQIVLEAAQEGTSKSGTNSAGEEPLRVVAKNLKIPWETIFLPNNRIFVTERPGRVLLIDDSNLKTIEIKGVRPVGEGGLLGAAIHPEFELNNYIYLYYTTINNDQLENHVYRYTLSEDTLSDEKLILGGIKGASNHDGGRIAFGPDTYLYITTGDAENPNLAQDTNSLNGKILRIKDNGDIPEDNPFGNAVYSYGHRNPQGLTWDSSGRLWSTEHGPSGVNTGWDELNLIEKGKNYGWPLVKGDETKENIVTPVLHSGKSTWAPASAVFYNGFIYFGGLRGSALYKYEINTGKFEELFKNEFGRIRDVSVSTNNRLYITTSNTDGRGVPSLDDDRLIELRSGF